MASKKEPTSVADTKGSSNPGLNDPYLDARREWNERYGAYISRAKNWRLMAFGVLGVCLVQTVGLVTMATQNKLVPYVVQVDKLGSVVPVARADQMNKTDERVVKALLARFISDARGVVSDGIAQRQMIDRTYAMLSNGTRALSIGAITNKLRWKANLTLAFNPPTNERQIRVNPIGVFITDLSWSQVL